MQKGRLKLAGGIYGLGRMRAFVGLVKLVKWKLDVDHIL